MISLVVIIIINDYPILSTDIRSFDLLEKRVAAAAADLAKLKKKLAWTRRENVPMVVRKRPLNS